MTRCTAAQFKRIEAAWKKGQPEKSERVRVRPAKKAKLQVTENHIEKQIADFLRLRGWTVVRQQSGLFRRLESDARVRVGTVGVADWYAVRARNASVSGKLYGNADFFYYEVKAPGKKPTPDQSAWLEQQRAEGLEAEWFDSLDGLSGWYKDRFYA